MSDLVCTTNSSVVHRDNVRPDVETPAVVTPTGKLSNVYKSVLCGDWVSKQFSSYLQISGFDSLKFRFVFN